MVSPVMEYCSELTKFQNDGSFSIMWYPAHSESLVELQLQFI